MTETGRKDFIDELKAMKGRMEDLFMRNFETGAARKAEKDEEESGDEWVPASDIIDSGNQLIYWLDLPGVVERDIQVECKAGRLWVSGLRKSDLLEGEAIRVERPKGAFSRAFKFPCPVNEDAIQAEFKKGVLKIRVPKSSAECRTHRIEVHEVE